jgi:hypothetical protein
MTTERSFSKIFDNAVIVSSEVFNGKFIVATPHNLYEVRDGKLELMKFVEVKDE